MEEVEIPRNPAASLDALAATPELTLGKMAVLTRINSPILVGETSDIPSTLVALWIIASPFDEVLANRRDFETPALRWGERMEPAEYRRRIIDALDAVQRYYDMLPRAEADSKKKRAPGTDRSPSSPSGSAAPTGGGSTTSSAGCPPSRPPSSGGATPRVPAASRAARSRRTKSRSCVGE